jgi:hypothetical protein
MAPRRPGAEHPGRRARLGGQAEPSPTTRVRVAPEPTRLPPRACPARSWRSQARQRRPPGAPGKTRTSGTRRTTKAGRRAWRWPSQLTRRKPRSPSPTGAGSRGRRVWTSRGRQVVSRRFGERGLALVEQAAAGPGRARHPTPRAATCLRRSWGQTVPASARRRGCPRPRRRSRWAVSHWSSRRGGAAAGRGRSGHGPAAGPPSPLLKT